MSKIRLGYTVIQHGPRIHFNLSLAQYTLGAAIYHLSNNPKAPVAGWCNASKEQLAEYFGLSERSVFNLINDLVSGGWVERNPDPALKKLGLLRTTSSWYDRIENFQANPAALETAKTQAATFAATMQNLQPTTMQNLQPDPAKIADNSNTYNYTLDTNLLRDGFAKKNRVENPFAKKPGDRAPKSPPVAPPPPRSERSPEVQALLDEMAPYWHIAETRFFASYAKLTAFLSIQETKGDLDFVAAQFRAYRDGRGVEPHTLDNYLGSAENGWTGAWNSCDWVKKFASKITRAQAVQATSQPNAPASRQSAAEAAIQRVLARTQPQGAQSEETDTFAAEA